LASPLALKANDVTVLGVQLLYLPLNNMEYLISFFVLVGSIAAVIGFLVLDSKFPIIMKVIDWTIGIIVSIILVIAATYGVKIIIFGY
jgi:hypothetical protein